MIGAILTLANEVVEIRVDGNEVYFKSSSYGSCWAPIEGLRLNLVGVIKEFPDLEGDPKWEEKAAIRFKTKIKNMKSEDAKINYIIADLKKHGYTPKYKQKKGFRPEKL